MRQLPDWEKGWARLGSVLFRLKRLEESLQAYEKGMFSSVDADSFLQGLVVIFTLRHIMTSHGYLYAFTVLSLFDPTLHSIQLSDQLSSNQQHYSGRTPRSQGRSDGTAGGGSGSGGEAARLQHEEKRG